MPTVEKMTIQSIQKLGIIAGGGDLPVMLSDACATKGIKTFVIGFDGQKSKVEADFKAKLGQIGKIIKAFQKQGIHDLVMIGSIKRPSFSELIPDLKAAKFLAQNAGKAMGDSDLLSALKGFLEKEGFTIHGVQAFVPELLVPESVITEAEPSKDDWVDIRRGIEILEHTAVLDIGQAVVVQEGLVLGVEAIEGTAALIERCGDLRRKGRKGALIKLCKTQQDLSLDLPTVGLQTIEAVHKAGFGGIAIHAQKTLLINKEALVTYANKHHLYIIGVDPDNL